jgi:hypothetical protein
MKIIKGLNNIDVQGRAMVCYISNHVTPGLSPNTVRTLLLDSIHCRKNDIPKLSCNSVQRYPQTQLYYCNIVSPRQSCVAETNLLLLNLKKVTPLPIDSALLL